jgi:spore coat protein H
MPLPARSLHIDEEKNYELERNLWNDQYVAATMRVNGQSSKALVRYRGGHTRTYPKRSYEVVRRGRVYHYNAEYDDPSMIRNALSFRFFEWLKVPSPRTKHVLLYRNGEPLGVYLEIEGVERRFFRRRGIGYASLFYAVNNDADFGLHGGDGIRGKSSLLSGYEHKSGGYEERSRLAALIRGMHERDGARAASFLDSRLDTDNYLRWLAGAVLTGNYDGFEQNYALYRHRKSGKFRIVPWDYEGTWGRNCYGNVVSSGLVDTFGYNALTAKLLEQPVYRARYKTILTEALRGPFTERKLMPVVRGMMSELAPHIRADTMRRWSYRDFRGEEERIRTYIRERRRLIAAAIRKW